MDRPSDFCGIAIYLSPQRVNNDTKVFWSIVLGHEIEHLRQVHFGNISVPHPATVQREVMAHIVERELRTELGEGQRPVTDAVAGENRGVCPGDSSNCESPRPVNPYNYYHLVQFRVILEYGEDARLVHNTTSSDDWYNHKSGGVTENVGLPRGWLSDLGITWHFYGREWPGGK